MFYHPQFWIQRFNSTIIYRIPFAFSTYPSYHALPFPFPFTTIPLPLPPLPLPRLPLLSGLCFGPLGGLPLLGPVGGVLVLLRSTAGPVGGVLVLLRSTAGPVGGVPVLLRSTAGPVGGVLVLLCSTAGLVGVENNGAAASELCFSDTTGPVLTAELGLPLPTAMPSLLMLWTLGVLSLREGRVRIGTGEAG